MENRKGNGIFLGVVSIATLIVAIIGATFAYFSASISSEEGSVNLAAYEMFDVAVTSVERVYPTTTALESSPAKDGLIPLQPTKVIGSSTYLLHALNSNSCLDDRGYMVCALYKATLTNSGTEAVTLNLEVKTNSNNSSGVEGATAFTDLTFQSLTGGTGTFVTAGTATTLPENAGISGEVTGATVTAVGSDTNSGVTEHYFVVYLNETGDEDNQSEQMGATYTGQVVYTTVAGGNRLTGQFNLGA